MASGTIKPVLKFVDATITIAGTNPVSATPISSGQIVSCEFLYSNDFYYATDKGTDNRTLNLSISATSGRSIMIVQGNNMPSTPRTLTVRVWYID